MPSEQSFVQSTFFFFFGATALSQVDSNDSELHSGESCLHVTRRVV